MTLMLAVIFLLLLISVFLLIVEIFFIPGTTLFGIAGGIGASIAIYFAFQESNFWGYTSLAVGLLFFILFFFIGKRMMNKSKLNLDHSIQSKVNTYNNDIANIGDTGKVLTVLRPNGKAFINNKKIEVYSLGNYIEKDTLIEIIKIEENKIFVKTLNQ